MTDSICTCGQGPGLHVLPCRLAHYQPQAEPPTLNTDMGNALRRAEAAGYQKAIDEVVAYLRLRGDEAWPSEEHFKQAKYRAVATRLKMQSANFHGAAHDIEAGKHKPS